MGVCVCVKDTSRVGVGGGKRREGREKEAEESSLIVSE